MMPPLETVGRGGPYEVYPLAERLEPFTMKMLPCAMPCVLLAASCTEVMVGVVEGGGAVPPVVIVPEPVKFVRVKPVARLPEMLPVRVNVPVAPA